MPDVLDYTIKNFYPDIGSNLPKADWYSQLVETIITKTAELVAHWQSLGFCHGVLNTDNMSILGLTIDYGPFAFMDYYNPKFVSNSSDHHGRYKYEAQPEICLWNLHKFAEALHPTV